MQAVCNHTSGIIICVVVYSLQVPIYTFLQARSKLVSHIYEMKTTFFGIKKKRHFVNVKTKEKHLAL